MDLGGGLGKKEGGGGWYPNAHYGLILVTSNLKHERNRKNQAWNDALIYK